MSLDDPDRPRMWHHLRNRGDTIAAAPPETPWDEAVSLGCQALLRGSGDVRAVYLDGGSVEEPAVGTRLPHLMDRARTIAQEYGVQAAIDCERGRFRVTLEHRARTSD
jgi:hypothetical protein